MSSIVHKILYVEDDQAWHSVIENILPEYDVQIASSFKDAQNKTLTDFDLMLVNIHLLDDRDYLGESFLGHLKESGLNIPCIVLTGGTGGTGSVRGLFERYQIMDVFIKGQNMNRREFRKVVRRILSETDKLAQNGST